MTTKHRKQDEPTADELLDIPESKPGARRFGRGSEGLRNAREYFATVRGRPKKGEQPIGTTARSLRLPNNAWTELEQRAEQEGVSLNKLLRKVIADWLYIVERGGFGYSRKRQPQRRRARKSA